MRMLHLRSEVFFSLQSSSRYIILCGDGVFRVHRSSRLLHSLSSVTVELHPPTEQGDRPKLQQT